MIRVCTGSRLHFGIFSLGPKPEEQPDELDDSQSSQRYWGGVGLMIQNPGVELVGRPAGTWLADGPFASRILQFATQFVEQISHREKEDKWPAMHFCLDRCPPEHQGLGSGTQLGLAVARLLSEFYKLAQKNAATLGPLVGRGVRSAIGLHGFDQGGFLVEAGKKGSQSIAPLVARIDFPEVWRIVLILPKEKLGLHGNVETQKLEELRQESGMIDPRDFLSRLVLLEMLPALKENDISEFGEAVFRFNREVGKLFRPVQGALYFDAQSEAIVDYIRSLGIKGTGQSSWGPVLFSVVESPEQAAFLAKRIQTKFHLQEDEIIITAATNGGAVVSQEG